MLPNIVAITGVPAEKVRIRAQDVGGGFGIRSQAYPGTARRCSRRAELGKPVKWVGSRFETIVSDHHGRAAHLEGELALDREGRFLGLRVRWVVNVGAYLSQPVRSSTRSTRRPTRSTSTASRRFTAATCSRSPIRRATTAYRGAGRPNVSYLVERLVDEAARDASTSTAPSCGA